MLLCVFYAPTSPSHFPCMRKYTCAKYNNSYSESDLGSGKAVQALPTIQYIFNKNVEGCEKCRQQRKNLVRGTMVSIVDVIIVQSLDMASSLLQIPLIVYAG